MDTPLRLEFELNQEESDAVLRPNAERGARLGRRLMWISAFASLFCAVVLGVTAGWGKAMWVFPVPLVVLVLCQFRPPQTDRQLEKMRRSPVIRAAVRQLQGIEIDHQGITTSWRGRLRRQCAWGRMTAAERHRTWWIFRSRGGVFIIPDRAFPTMESLAEFEAMIRERIPPHAWRDPIDGRA